MYASGEAIACMNQVRQLQVSHADGAGEASACMYESGEAIAGESCRWSR